MKRQLRIGASALALVSGMAGAAMVQAFDQTAENTADVTLNEVGNNSVRVVVGENGDEPTGLGSTAGGIAIGASTSLSATGVGGTYTGFSYDMVSATANNTGNIDAPNVEVTINNDLGVAASGVIAVTGAAVSHSETINGDSKAVNSDKGTVASSIIGHAINGSEGGSGGVVTVSDGILTGKEMLGNAASMNISAGGSSVSTSSTLIGIEGGDFSAATFGNVGGDFTTFFDGTPENFSIGQSSENHGNITASGNVLKIESINGSAMGASASIGAIGASSSVRASLVDSTVDGGPTFGTGGNGILQVTENMGKVTSEKNEITAGAVEGAGASVTISAMGAAGSVGISAVNSKTTENSAAEFGKVWQVIESESGQSQTYGVLNKGDISVKEGSITADGLAGAASSASIAAIGVSGSTYESYIGDQGSAGTVTFGAINTNISNSGNISVNNSSVLIGEQQDGSQGVTDISGTAASASLSGTGAVASVSSTAIASEGAHSGATFDAITQVVENTGSVTIGSADNTENVNVKVGDITGTAASTSISASGASAGVSTSAIVDVTSDGGYTLAEFSGNIGQTVTNGETSSAEQVKIENATINTGSISGTAASAAITASGASASVSASMIDTETNSMISDAGVFQSPVTQTVTNNEKVSITGSSIASGDLSGTAASAAITASGASASISASMIDAGTNSMIYDAGVFQSPVTQTVTNNAEVSITESSIASGDLSEVAASASIAAIGASASASDSIISGSRTGSGTTFADLTQTAINNNTITVSNSQISVANLTGTGASAMISVVGASASTGVSTIN